MQIFSTKLLASLARTNITQTKWFLGIVKAPAAVTPAECGPDMEDRGICVKDAHDPQICFEQPRVVIVGAGMAGLSAAARLSKNGMDNVVILEAFERPGGRIQSCWLGDVVAELGAHWRTDTCCSHPINKLSASENPPRPGVPGSEYPRGLFDRVVAGKMGLPMTIAAYHKFRQIEQEAAQIYCLGGNKQHGSLINFMSLRIQQELHSFPEEEQHDAARIMFGLIHMLMARCSSDTGMLYADNEGCFMNMPGGYIRVPLGLIGTIAPILRQIPEGVIKYCKPVNCIHWGSSQRSGYRAMVYTTDGDEYPADYVIITVSLGVLNFSSNRLFCPALPSSKIDAIRCLGYGHCNKIYLEYCRPFWYWHSGNLNFKFCADNPCSRCDWTRGLTAIEVVPHSDHVLCAWVVGAGACLMEGLPDRDVAEGLTQVLRHNTGNADIPYPVNVLRSQWSSNPFFYGAYSFEGCCTDGSAQTALSCPLPGPSEPVPPILLFAGEATVPGLFATVSGARLSGIREAERVVSLTLRYKGPPGRKDVYCEKKECKAC